MIMPIDSIAMTSKEEKMLEPVPFGRAMREKHFLFDPGYLNLNHGSFGAHPKYVQKQLEEMQRQCVARPDIFIRYEYPALLDKSRESLAKHLKLSSDDIVLVQNVSVATNTVLRNLKFNDDDAILTFSTAYGAVTKTVESIKESTNATAFQAKTTYPLSDDAVVEIFRDVVKQCKAAGKKPRIAIIDTISSMPGVYVPWERLVKICKDEGILSFIDGAHSIGLIDADIKAADPDFFTSNMHKWLFTPRGSALFYVPQRNQHLIRTTFPTSHGFVPLPSKGACAELINPLPKGNPKSAFAQLFEFVATTDNAPYLCVDAALRFRREACGGEEKIMRYCCDLAMRAAEKAAEVWGTEVMITDRVKECAMTNVGLPVKVKKLESSEGDLTIQEAQEAVGWIAEVLVREHNTFAATFVHGGKMWVRFCGQVYLEMADLERGIDILGQVCAKVRDGSWKAGA